MTLSYDPLCLFAITVIIHDLTGNFATVTHHLFNSSSCSF